MKTWTFKLTAAALLLVSVPKAQNNVLSPTEAEQGFELMFDGTIASFRSKFVNYVKNNSTNTNLDAGWILSTANEAITMSTGSLPDTRSVKQYRDFDLRLDYRNNGNQGVIYRHMLTGAFPWETGVEFSIDDNVSASPKVRVGSPYDLYAMPAASYYKTYSTNQWNSLRLVVKADSVEHWLNGTKVAGFKYNSTAFWSAVTNSKWNTYTNFCTSTGQRNSYIRQGYIGIQGDHGGTWLIRNFRILHDSLDTQNRVALGNLPVNVSKPKHGTGMFRAEKRGDKMELFLNPEMKAMSVEVYELNGRPIRHAAIADGSSKIVLNASVLNKGLYFARVTTSNGVHQAKFFAP